jgi:hypothetical protein
LFLEQEQAIEKELQQEVDTSEPVERGLKFDRLISFRFLNVFHFDRELDKNLGS